MLKARIITALIALVAVGIVLFVLPKSMAVPVIVALIAGGAYEWSRLAGFQSLPARIAYVVVVTLPAALVAQMVPAPAFSGVLWLALVWWLVAFGVVVRYPVRLPSFVAAVAGLLTLVPACFAMAALVRNTMLGSLSGVWLLLFVLVAIWAADVGAYFAGRAFGRHKLAPSVSPNKTWEGVFGGLALTAVIGALGAAYTGLAWYRLVPLCVVTGLVSIVGDLTVSLFKREAGVKDSGSLFPGHGGILDRIDSIAAGAPVFVAGIYLGHGPW